MFKFKRENLVVNVLMLSKMWYILTVMAIPRCRPRRLNHADLRSVFPKIHQHIDFPTRGKNTLDFVYTTQRGAYKALPLPHLGASDHITVMLMPAYRPLVKAIKPVHKQIQVWPEGSSEALQDCLTLLTGICLSRLPHITILQTSKSTQRLSLPTSPSVLMM